VAGGTVSLSNCTVSGNIAQGGDGLTSSGGRRLMSGSGFAAYGGGLYVAGGTVSLSNCIVSGNTAQGGNASSGYAPNGGSAYGGGLYVAAGSVTLRGITVADNGAQGGKGGYYAGKPGLGYGGLYIAAYASVYLDAFTVAHTINNTPDNIWGSYTIIP
jgi:hypothetical protein